MNAAPRAKCCHERAHIVDSGFHGHAYSTPVSRRIFCDVCRIQRWLDVEVALARSEAELGMIPAPAAEAIAGCADVELMDLETVREQTRLTGHSLVGLLRVFQAVCPDDSGEYIHYGATTQDIQDTAQSLEMREVLDGLEDVLGSVLAGLAGLAGAHRATPALGRTHARAALPMTFGLKVAGWIDEILRHLDRLREMRPRVLAAQLFGGVGTMAAFGGQGPELLESFAGRLGLSVPSVGWHVARDRVAEYVMTLAMVTASMARIADEVRLLSRAEFGEVEERWVSGAVGSSTMPGKRNPEVCEQVAAIATVAAAQVGPALAAMRGDHERDSRALRVEWVCVTDVSHYGMASVALMDTVVQGLTVNPDRLRSNLARDGDQAVAERLMMSLGRHVGKQTALGRVSELSQGARDTGRPLCDLVRADPGVRAALSDRELDEIFDPGEYLGASELLTSRVTERATEHAAARAAGGTPGPAADYPAGTAAGRSGARPGERATAERGVGA